MKVGMYCTQVHMPGKSSSGSMFVLRQYVDQRQLAGRLDRLVTYFRMCTATDHKTYIKKRILLLMGPI